MGWDSGDLEVVEADVATSRSEPEPTFLVRLRIVKGEDEFTVTEELDFLSISYQLDLQGFVWNIHELCIAKVKFRL